MGWMVKAIVFIAFLIRGVISSGSELGATLMKERFAGWEPSGKMQETTDLHG